MYNSRKKKSAETLSGYPREFFMFHLTRFLRLGIHVFLKISMSQTCLCTKNAAGFLQQPVARYRGYLAIVQHNFSTVHS